MHTQLSTLIGRGGIVFAAVLVVVASVGAGVTVGALAADTDGRSPAREITGSAVSTAAAVASAGGDVASTTNAPTTAISRTDRKRASVSGADSYTAQNGVAVADGIAYVVSDGRILKIKLSTGEQLTSFAAPAGDTFALAYGDGSLWFADGVDPNFDGEIIELDPDTGAVRSRISTTYDPTGLAYGAGSLWVTDITTNSIHEYTPAGTEKNTFDVRGPTGSTSPAGLAYSAGHLWLGTRDGGLYQFTPDGTLDREVTQRDTPYRGLGGNDTALYGPGPDGKLTRLALSSGKTSNRTGPDVDGFERQSPGGWTISGNCNTQGISTTRAYRGTRSLVLSTAQPGGPCVARQQIDTDLNGSPVVFSTTVFDATVDADGGIVEYSTAETRGGADAIRVSYEAGRETRFKTYDASGELIEERTFEPIDSDTWYAVRITVFPGNSSAKIAMQNQSETFASAVLNASGAGQYTYAHLIAGGYEDGKQYFDDVSLAPKGTFSNRTGTEPNVSRVAFDYVDHGGNVNLEVNGDRRNVEDFAALDGATVGGAAVSVTQPTGSAPGTVVVDGTAGAPITAFSVGGQELVIDDVRFGPPTDLRADVEFSRLIPISSGYAVGETFTSLPSGVQMTVESFRFSTGETYRGGSGSRVDSLSQPFSPLAGAGFLPGNVNLRFNISSVTASEDAAGETVTIVGYDTRNDTTERRTVARTDETFPFAAPSLPSDRSTFPEVTADYTKQRIDGTGAYPWSAVGTVFGNISDGEPSRTCSGAVIEDNHVLTAAHCVYNPTTDEWLSSLSSTSDLPPTFIPGNDANRSPYESAFVTYIQTYEEYVQTGNRTYDLAVVTLEDEVGSRTGTFGYEAYPPDSNRYDASVHLTGYPSSAKARYVDQVNEQWDLVADGKGTGVGDEDCAGSTRCHALDTDGPTDELTVKGQSGGPVWYSDGSDRPTILSVMSAGPSGWFGDFTTTKTAAIRISEDTYSDVGRMVKYGNGIALPPTARATANDTSAIGGRPVELDATASADPNGDPLSYEWTQVSGPGVALSDPDSATPEFTAPTVEGIRDLVFEVTVRDGTGKSDTAQIRLRVAPGAISADPPDVTGDGNLTTDPDGDGVYEDVNGDGEATPGDATVLFNAVFDRTPAVTDNVALFDFNGDGSVTPGDATVLFNEIF